MGTTIRAELSEKNKYWLEKHRYLELRQFCLQYDIWKKAYLSINELSVTHPDLASYIKTNISSDKTAKCAIAKEYYSKRMSIVEESLRETDPIIVPYLLKAVTQGYSYTYLRINTDIPYSRDEYYESYRKFFWILSKKRD